MAGFRLVSPTDSGSVEIDSGTLNLQRTPAPAPVGHPNHGSTHPPHHLPPLQPTRLTRKAFSTLRQGDSGEEVVRLQKLLNARLRPSPNLPCDGVFGPRTAAALLRFHRAQKLLETGVTDPATWFKLLSSREVITPAMSGSVEVAGFGQFVDPKKLGGIGTWPLENKFDAVLVRTLPKLPASIRQQFEGLLSPEILAFTALGLVAWAGGQFFGYGELVDVVLLLSGIYYLGASAFGVGEDLEEFLRITVRATSDKDLDEAASHLARAISAIGVAAFLALVAKVAHKTGGSAAEEIEEEQKPAAARRSYTRTPEGLRERGPYRPDEEGKKVIARKTALKPFAEEAGMKRQHLENFQRFAKNNDYMIVVRDTNGDGLKWQDKPGYLPKPHDVMQLKTAKEGELAGLVVKPEVPTPEQEQEFAGLKENGWDYDDKGVLRDPKGNGFYGDYDLQGIYEKTGVDASGKPIYKPVDTNDPEFQSDINHAVRPGTDMIKHGANDDFVVDGKMGRQPKPDEGYTVITGDGVERVNDTASLQRMYQEKGLDWKYNDYQSMPAASGGGGGSGSSGS